MDREIDVWFFSNNDGRRASVGEEAMQAARQSFSKNFPENPGPCVTRYAAADPVTDLPLGEWSASIPRHTAFYWKAVSYH